MTPETHFAENDGVSIAYQVFGDGPQDLIDAILAYKESDGWRT